MRETRVRDFRRCFCRSLPPRRAAIFNQTLSFPPCRKGARQREGQRERMMSPEALEADAEAEWSADSDLE